MVAYEVTNMSPKSIFPSNHPLIIIGKLSYDETLGAFSVIRLKKRFIDEFSDLKLGSNWFYQLEYLRTYDQAIKRIEGAQRLEQGIPILLFIYQENDENYD